MVYVPRGAHSTNSQRRCTSPRGPRLKYLNFSLNHLLNTLWSTQGERLLRHNFNLRYHLII